MNRETFVTLNRTRLFTADQVVDFVQSERERVLDEGIAQIQKRINGIFDAYRGETNERLTERPYNMANGMGESILILKELREDKDGE